MHRPSRLWLLCALALASLVSPSGIAHAQHLGGTIARAGAANGHDGVWLALLGVGLVGLAFVALFTGGQSARAQRPGPQARAWMNVDVSVVRIGIDLRSREFMQRELGKIVIKGSPQSRSLLESLGATVRLLRKCDAAWVYGGSSNYHPMSPPVAEGVFTRHTNEARGKHTMVTPKDAEGPRVALITLVVAARREIRDFFGGHRAEINAVLDDLERLTPAELVAAEVVWTPGDADDLMDGPALEALLPDIAKLPAPPSKKGRPVGRLHCAYCRGPFATELPTCPHCGAPAPADAVPE